MATGLASAEVSVAPEGPKQIVLKERLLDSDGHPTPNLFINLNASFGGDFKRVPSGSNSKETYANGSIIVQASKGDEIKNPFVLQQTVKQIEFYQKYAASDAFKKVAVPFTHIIVDEDKKPLGTAAEQYGISWEEYKRGGMRTPSGAVVTGDQINEFVKNYEKLIQETGFPHDDFILGDDSETGKEVRYLADWQNIRIGENGELRFVDYYGRNGLMRYNGKSIDPNSDQSGNPTNPEYMEHSKEDPARVKAALEGLFQPQQ